MLFLDRVTIPGWERGMGVGFSGWGDWDIGESCLEVESEVVGWVPRRGETGAATLRLGFVVGDVFVEGRIKVAEVVVES